jgi:hypothetical protein
MTVHSLRTRTLLVIPIRLGLGLLLLGGARLAGAANGPALLAFVIGTFGITFLIFNDPRARFARGAVEPLALPADAELSPLWKQALAASIPSTIAVFLLGLTALARPVLAALLAGVEAGLGVAAILSLGRVDPSLYVDPHTDAVYRKGEG